jgi:hypothetical protein
MERMKTIIFLVIMVMFMGGCTMAPLTYYSGPTAEEKAQALNDIPALVDEIKRKQGGQWESREEEIRSKKWSSRITNAVINKDIILGMTKEQVIASWYRPNDINRSVGSWGVHEQWIYNNTYLYFEDGILTSFQD